MIIWSGQQPELCTTSQGNSSFLVEEQLDMCNIPLPSARCWLRSEHNQPIGVQSGACFCPTPELLLRGRSLARPPSCSVSKSQRGPVLDSTCRPDWARPISKLV